MNTEYTYIRTGPENGWRMSRDIFARCPVCGHYMSLDPAKDEVCPCGNLYKDAGMGRFGARTRDASIELYRQAKEEETGEEHT